MSVVYSWRMFVRGMKSLLLQTYEERGMTPDRQAAIAAMDPELRDFIVERNRMLTEFDLVAARKRADEATEAQRLPRISDEGLIGGLHNARLLCKDIDRSLRFESAAWLRANRPNVYANSMGALPDHMLPGDEDR